MFYNVDFFPSGYTKHLIWDLVNLMDFVDEQKRAEENCGDLRSCVMIELLVADDEDPIMGASALSEMV